MKRQTQYALVTTLLVLATAIASAQTTTPTDSPTTPKPIHHVVLGTETRTVRVRNSGDAAGSATIEYIREDGSIGRTVTTQDIQSGEWIDLAVDPDPNAAGVTISGPAGLSADATATDIFDTTRHVIVAGLFDALPAMRSLLLWNYSAHPTAVAFAAIGREGNFSARSSLELAPGQSVRLQLANSFPDVNPTEIAAVQVTSEDAVAGLELAPTPVRSSSKTAGFHTLAISNPADLKSRVDASLRAIVSGVPAPPTDWGTLISAQLSGKANQLFTYHLLGSETYSAAAAQGAAALKYLSIGDMTNANIAYSRMLSLRYDGDVLFGAAAQSSIDAVDQVDTVVARARALSFAGAGIIADVACLNPWCGRAIEFLDVSTQWAVTKSIDGVDAANRELYSTIFVKALLATPIDGTSLSKVADESVNHLVGSTAGKYYDMLAKVVKSPAVRTSILKSAASIPRNLLSAKMEDGLKAIGDFASESRNGAVTLPAPPPQAVSLLMSPTSATLIQGKSVQFSLTLIRQNFFAAFPLSAMVKAGNGQGAWDPYRDVAPVGMTIGFTPPSPGGAAAVMTISAAASLAPGTYRLNVFGLGGVNVTTHGFFGTLVVTPAPPATPSLSSPSNGATGVATASLLVWLPPAGVLNYDVYFGTSSSPSLAGNVSTGSFKPTLSAGTRYYWRVVAKNGAGSSPSSPTWSFATQSTVPAASALSSPGNGMTGVATASSLIWLPSPGAASYDVYFGTSSSPSLAGNVTTGSFKPTLSAGTRYYWRVVAKNGAGSSPSSPTWSFTTQSAVPKISGYSWTTTPRNRQNFGGAISGSGFVSGTLAWFCVSGGSTCYQQPASLVTVDNADSLTVRNANLTTGTWQIYVQTAAGQSARSSSFSVKP